MESALQFRLGAVTGQNVNEDAALIQLQFLDRPHAKEVNKQRFLTGFRMYMNQRMFRRPTSNLRRSRCVWSFRNHLMNLIAIHGWEIAGKTFEKLLHRPG